MPENDELDDVEQDEPDTDLEDDGQDDEPGSPPAPYVAPTADEFAKLQRKLQRQEDRITRLVGKPPKGKAKPADVDAELAAQLRGQDDEPDEDAPSGPNWRNIAIQSSAASQIQAAGFTGTAKQAARLAKLIDTAGLVPDRNGSFDLEDEVDELKEEYPTLFGGGAGPGRRPAPVVRRGDARGRAEPKDPSLATSQALLRQAGYR